MLSCGTWDLEPSTFLDGSRKVDGPQRRSARETGTEVADVTAQPSSTYEAQQAMAEAILQKLQELNYISKN